MIGVFRCLRRILLVNFLQIVHQIRGLNNMPPLRYRIGLRFGGICLRSRLCTHVPRVVVTALGVFQRFFPRRSVPAAPLRLSCAASDSTSLRLPAAELIRQRTSSCWRTLRQPRCWRRQPLTQPFRSRLGSGDCFLLLAFHKSRRKQRVRIVRICNAAGVRFFSVADSACDNHRTHIRVIGHCSELIRAGGKRQEFVPFLNIHIRSVVGTCFHPSTNALKSASSCRLSIVL